MSTPTDSFADLMSRLDRGDELAARQLVERFTGRLTDLARRRLGTRLSAKVDAEDVLQSAYNSFFAGRRRGQYARFKDWSGLWNLLACITSRKCSRQFSFFLSQCRDIRLESGLHPLEGDSSAAWEAISRGPSPTEEAIMAETLGRIMISMEPHERQILQLTMEGEEGKAIALRVGYSLRTVQRVLDSAKGRLERILGESPIGGGE